MEDQNDRHSSWRVAVASYAPLLLWIGLIFVLSSPQGAADQTSRIIGPLLHFLYPDISPDLEANIHAIVRKCAHFTEYGVLAFIAVRAFATTVVVRPKRYAFALLLVVIIASLDEFNQSFEPSRTSSFWDVLLDASGGAAAIAAILLWRRRQ